VILRSKEENPLKKGRFGIFERKASFQVREPRELCSNNSIPNCLSK